MRAFQGREGERNPLGMDSCTEGTLFLALQGKEDLARNHFVLRGG